MTRYLIAGGSIAGMSAAQAILSVDPQADIGIISDERPFYYRPMITHLLDGSRTAEDIAFLEDVPVRHISGRAAALDAKGRKVVLDSKEPLSFDRLLIATGSSARVPDIAGIEKALTLRSIADAERLMKSLAGKKKALIIGGGFVGIKAAEALLGAGLEVTVAEELDRVLHPRLDKAASDIVRGRLKERGIKILTSESVVGILPDKVKLSSGSEEKADVVVSAIGTEPNIGWLEGSGVKTNRGVVVDDALMTSVDGIYAAGDVAEAVDAVRQKPMVSALWTNAVTMGRTAGLSMAGQKTKCQGLLEVMNASEIGGLPVVSAGEVSHEGGEAHISNTDGYRKLVFDGDLLTGMVFLGNVSKAGLYVGLIKARRPLGGLKDKAITGTLSYADLAGKAADAA